MVVAVIKLASELAFLRSTPPRNLRISSEAVHRFRPGVEGKGEGDKVPTLGSPRPGVVFSPSKWPNFLAKKNGG